jgi:hypothetical protein
MDNFEPDYERYSYKELLDVRTHIDREQFPERLRVVERLILKKGNGKNIDDEDNSFNGQFVFGLAAGELLIWLIVGLLALLGYSFF